MAEGNQDLRAKVTIQDIARETGVSPAAVSLALRDKPGVSPETKQRILDSAAALGYLLESRPGPGSRTSAGSIGLIVKVRPDDIPTANQFYGPMLAGIEAACRQSQINLYFAHLQVDERNNALEAPRLLTEPTADGLLFLGIRLNDSIQRILDRQRSPIVLVDAYASTDAYDAVTIDNEAGAHRATSYLIEQGHRHIAIAGSLPVSYPSVQQRRQGYEQALAEHGLMPHFIDSVLHPDAAQPAVAAYLVDHPEVSAIFGGNDEVTIAAMNAARQVGRRLPDDLSVIGFDNISLAQHVMPALSTMRIDKVGMGRLAAQLLFDRIEHPDMGRVELVMSPELIERDSVMARRNQPSF